MKQLRKKEGKVDITIIILLTVIVIAGAILALKVTGVIKPQETNYDSNIDSSSSNNKTSSYEDVQDWEESITTSLKTVKNVSTIVIIVGLIVGIGLNIGVCKLYQKLNIPMYIVMFNFIWPILSITQNLFTGILGTILSIIYSILQVASLFYYFKSVGMTGSRAFIPILGTLFTGFGASALILGGGGFLAIIGVGSLIAFLIAFIISNVKLGEMFNKGIGFKIGLAILPFIFQPILGYSKD